MGDLINTVRTLMYVVTFVSLALPAWAGAPYRDREVIVKLRGQAGTDAPISQKATTAFMAKAKSNHQLDLVTSFPNVNLHHFRLHAGATKSVQDLINELSSDPEVQYAEPNYIVTKAAVSDVSADAIYTLSQVELLNSSGFAMTQAPIQAPPAWGILTNSKSHTVVAVIDTGLAMSHPAFANSVWTNKGEIANNGIDDDGNGFVDDVHGWNFAYNNNNPTDDEGHGTHVSGIVLGVGQNIFTYPAPATDVEIMPLKFLDSTGSGSTVDAISAVYYAANMGAKVMNNSWGGGAYSQGLAEAITYAYNKDVLFVAAAGNASNNNDASPNFPASYDMPNVVSVAASDASDVLASFSNYGVQTVPLSGPGVNILSTYLNGSYATMSGTSMASPFVAGVAALMRYQNSSMNCWQIRNLLLQSTDKISNLSSYVQTSGRLNVYKSVYAANTTAVDPSKPNYLLSVDPQNRALASTVDARGGGCGMVAVMGKDFWNNNDPKARLQQVIVTLAVLMVPILLIAALRRPEKRGYKRRHERYELNSSVTFKVGNKQLVGAVRTISLGGSDLNTEALLKQGSVITMSIASPDGSSKIDVQGHVVWSEEQKRYGVAFDQVTEGIKAQIMQWQTGLKKAS